MIFRKIFPALAAPLAGLFLLSAAALHAGDSAAFVDLGFSPDGGAYMFAQYGVKSGVLIPWAELYLVDVKRNDYIPGGKISYTHDGSINAGQDGSGALYRVMTQNPAFAARHGISYPSQGQPLYIALDGDPAYDGDTITFRDFVSGVFYRASVTEAIGGEDDNVRSSFFITLQCITDLGDTASEKTFVIGTPDLKRPSVLSYRIKKVLIAPSGNSLIFVIEMKRRAEDGYDIRYMVEALLL